MTFSDAVFLPLPKLVQISSYLVMFCRCDANVSHINLRLGTAGSGPTCGDIRLGFEARPVSGEPVSNIIYPPKRFWDLGSCNLKSVTERSIEEQHGAVSVV